MNLILRYISFKLPHALCLVVLVSAMEGVVLAPSWSNPWSDRCQRFR